MIFDKVDERFDKMDNRFDSLELTLAPWLTLGHP